MLLTKTKRMKKKFLFPIIFLILLGLLVQTGLADILFILLTPINIFILIIEVNLGLSQGTLTGGGTYSIVLVGIMQFFLLGYIWDIIANYLKNLINEPFQD